MTSICPSRHDRLTNYIKFLAPNLTNDKKKAIHHGFFPLNCGDTVESNQYESEHQSVLYAARSYLRKNLFNKVEVSTKSEEFHNHGVNGYLLAICKLLDAHICNKIEFPQRLDSPYYPRMLGTKTVMKIWSVDSAGREKKLYDGLKSEQNLLVSKILSLEKKCKEKLWKNILY